MKRISGILLAGVLALPGAYAVTAVSAEPELTPSLIMNQIKVLTASERGGDELYFDISIYKANQPTQYARIPARPMHWPSQYLDKVQQVSLWSQPLKAGQAVTLIVSLIESDGSVVNPDDLIGSVRLALKNDKGALQTSWSMPNSLAGVSQDAMQTFEMQGQGKYQVSFSLKK